MNIPDTLSAMLEDSTDRVAHKLAPLACSFPSLRDLFSDPALIEHFRRADPENFGPRFEGFETSVDLLAALQIIAASDLAGSGVHHAAKFILGVSGRRGVFDLFEALARWDGAHRAAFVAWAGAQ
jgi:hypothetical protein